MYYNRFTQDWATSEIYDELRGIFETDVPETHTVNVSDLRLKLVDNRVVVAGKEMPVNERGSSVLYDRLGLGKITTILSEDDLKIIQPRINEYLGESDGTLVLKSRRGEIQSVVSEKYKEIPYTDVVTVMEHLGARPIRVYQNDYSLRMQATFDQHRIEPKDNEPINLGVQLITSDMGAAALKFEVFLYRWICHNGMIMGKKSVGSFRTIHVQSLAQAEEDTKVEIQRVLEAAEKQMTTMINQVIARTAEPTKVLEFLSKRPIGKRALALVAPQIETARTMWDVVNILTEAGHSDGFSQSLQNSFEEAAGELLAVAAA